VDAVTTEILQPDDIQHSHFGVLLDFPLKKGFGELPVAPHSFRRDTQGSGCIVDAQPPEITFSPPVAIPSSSGTIRTSPPRLAALRLRACSTKTCRIAFAATLKKWARFSQSCFALASFRYAS
jgi:hypothetical protein